MGQYLGPIFDTFNWISTSIVFQKLVMVKLFQIILFILVIEDGFSLVVSEIIEQLYFYVYVDVLKYLLRLGSEIIIWFSSKINNNDVLSLVIYGGTSYGKRPWGEFEILLVSKIGTYDGIWLDVIVDWTVGNFEDPFQEYLWVYYLDDHWEHMLNPCR